MVAEFINVDREVSPRVDELVGAVGFAKEPSNGRFPLTPDEEVEALGDGSAKYWASFRGEPLLKG